MNQGDREGNTVSTALSGFSADLRHWLQENAVSKTYGRTDLLMAPGDTGNRIGVIISGHAHVVLHEPGYREIAVEELGPGDTYGEINFFSGRVSPPNWKLVAAEPCATLEIDSALFSDVARTHHDFSYMLLRKLARKVIALDRTIFESKRRKRALQQLISRESSSFPEFVKGSYFRRNLDTRRRELALSDGPILIMGESGVGRELLAYSIYEMSNTYKEVFLLFDISPPESTVRDELTDEALLFGREETSPDGSKREVPGYIELCEGGTLLIRGLGHLNSSIQKKIVETLKTGSFQLSNSLSKRKANFRLIVSTKLTQGENDLETYPLITVLMDRSIHIPPLRERRREIASLADYYVRLHSQELRKEVPRLPEQSLKMLMSYSWPGNDLELSNTLRRAMLVAEGGVIHPRDIYFEVKRAEGEGKVNLLRIGQVGRMVRSPLFPAVLQSAAAPFFFILIGLLFLGPPDPLQNPASLFSWALGWPALIAMAILWAAIGVRCVLWD